MAVINGQQQEKVEMGIVTIVHRDVVVMVLVDLIIVKFGLTMVLIGLGSVVTSK